MAMPRARSGRLAPCLSRYLSRAYVLLIASVLSGVSSNAGCSDPRVRPDQGASEDKTRLAAPVLPAHSAVQEPSSEAKPTAPAVAEEPKPDRVAEALRYDPIDPLGNLESADALDRGADSANHAPVAPPARGCALQGSPRRIWSDASQASIVALGSGFVVAGYHKKDAGERVFVVHLPSEGLPEPVASVPIDTPHPVQRVAPPGLAADAGQGVALVYSDGARTLRLLSLQVGAAHGGGASRELAQEIDTRFAPAVAFGKHGPLVAFTLGTTPMRTVLARIDAQGKVLQTHDITPDAMGAAAPAFVDGARPLMLVTADARSGMSPIARTTLDAEGLPGPAQVAAPVGMLSEPPELAAAHSSAGAFVAYTGLGSAATSAVGLVRIAPKPGAPEALVKGTAYGALHTAAVSAGEFVVVAADAPLGTGKSPKHEILVVRIDDQGQGPLLHIAGPDGDAAQVALARNKHGEIALLFTSKDGVYVASVRCEG
jgi:hypothetical protein